MIKFIYCRVCKYTLCFHSNRTVGSNHKKRNRVKWFFDAKNSFFVVCLTTRHGKEMFWKYMNRWMDEKCASCQKRVASGVVVSWCEKTNICHEIVLFNQLKVLLLSFRTDINWKDLIFFFSYIYLNVRLRKRKININFSCS